MNKDITNISVDVLKVHPRNTEFFDDIKGEEYERFKKSIEEDGLLSPLVVSPDMTVISGHQRLKACKELGYRIVPVIINDELEDEDEKLKKLIAANFGRARNDPIKQAKLLKEYEKLSGVRHGGNRKQSGDNRHLNQDQIAEELGISSRQLRDIKKLTKLLPDFQEIISEGRITPTAGYKVIAKLSEDEQQKLLEQLPATQKFTQKQIEEYVSRIQELENINAGYKLKLESKEKERPVSESLEQLVEEKQKLESEKRRWYEKAQGYKNEIDKVQGKLEQLKEQKQKVIETVPEDYQTLKKELELTKEELRRANFVIKNKEERPDIAKKFGIPELIQSLSRSSNDINIYQFADDALADATEEEANRIKELANEINEVLNTILSKLKTY